jgi:hypothetical protein
MNKLGEDKAAKFLNEYSSKLNNGPFKELNINCLKLLHNTLDKNATINDLNVLINDNNKLIKSIKLKLTPELEPLFKDLCLGKEFLFLKCITCMLPSLEAVKNNNK